MAYLKENSYGKQRVRLTKVENEGKTRTVFELTVEVMLYGDFEEVYTEGDNSPCVPTDTMKNTVYVVAKRTDFTSPEEYAVALAQHFVSTYPQIKGTQISVTAPRWRRIKVDGAPHSHAFVKGNGLRTANVSLGEVPGEPEAPSAKATVRSGLSGLEVFKSGGSGFSGFHKDEYTTLGETEDRILATTIDVNWRYTGETIADYEKIAETVEAVILQVFATHQSPSLQATLYVMGESALAAAQELSEISFSMPNQHHILFDLSRFGMENDNEIFYGTDSPFGVITGTVAR